MFLRAASRCPRRMSTRRKIADLSKFCAFAILMEIFPPETVTTCIFDFVYGLHDLTMMRIESKQIDEEYAHLIAGLLFHSKTITRLIIHSCIMFEDGVKIIAESLRENTLIEELDFMFTSCGDTDVIAIASMLKENSSIERLYLAGNNFRSAGVKALCEALSSNTSLTYLHLGNLTISNEVRQMLEKAKEKPISIIDSF